MNRIKKNYSNKKKLSTLNMTISNKFSFNIERKKCWGSLWITSFMWQSLNGFFGIITHYRFLFVGPKADVASAKGKTNRKLTPEIQENEIFQYQKKKKPNWWAEGKKQNYHFILFPCFQCYGTDETKGRGQKKKGLKPNVFQILILNITNFSLVLFAEGSG